MGRLECLLLSVGSPAMLAVTSLLHIPTPCHVQRSSRKITTPSGSTARHAAIGRTDGFTIIGIVKFPQQRNVVRWRVEVVTYPVSTVVVGAEVSRPRAYIGAVLLFREVHPSWNRLCVVTFVEDHRVAGQR